MREGFEERAVETNRERDAARHQDLLAQERAARSSKERDNARHIAQQTAAVLDATRVSAHQQLAE